MCCGFVSKRFSRLGGSVLSRVLLCVTLVGVGACGASSRSAQRTASVEKRIADLAQREADNSRRLEDLNNRLFLIEERGQQPSAAWQPAAESQAPRLPVVRIRPSDTPDEAGEWEAAGEPNADQLASEDRSVHVQAQGRGRSLVANDDIEYSGAALQRGRRPMLRLNGAGSRTAAFGVRPSGGIDPSHVKEKLPIVAVAKKKEAAAIAAAAPDSPVAMRAYAEAMKRYRSGHHKAAAEAFRVFISHYAKHAYVDNAMYWLAECYYDLKQYRHALDMFRRVVEEYPNGNKAPDALLKMGYSYLKLKDTRNARTILAQVVEIFPRTRVARLASQTISHLD